MNKINALIVDDEQDSRETLRSYLNKYCPQVHILKEAANIQEARTAILKHEPQLVFLDVEMPHGNAFDLLEQWETVPFETIFVTAFSKYAIQAFNLSAAHYLLKPLEIEALEKAVSDANERIIKNKLINTAQILLENIRTTGSQNRKLVLPLMEGFDIVRANEILYCEANDNFTCFYFNNGKKSMICRSLKFYDEVLEPLGFCRIHRSFLVNMDVVVRYNKGKGGSVILENGKELLVSNSRKETLVNKLANL